LQQDISAKIATSIMPLNETDKAWIREYVKAVHERHGWGKLTGAIKDWGGAGAAIAILILAVTQWTAYIEFRTQTTDRLGIIEKKLTTSELQSQASLPQSAFEKALPEIRSTVAAARKDRISVPAAVIEGLRSKLLASNSETPDFWPTVSEFVSYRSALSYHAAAASAPPIAVYSAKLLPNCTDSEPTPMVITAVPTPESFTMSTGIYENCRVTLDSPEDNARINAVLTTSTPLLTFKHCLVVYRGGAVNLITMWNNRKSALHVEGHPPMPLTLTGNAIEFVDCLFDFSTQGVPPASGQQLTEMLLAQNDSTLKLPYP
jgi:hypothetical protein